MSATIAAANLRCLPQLDAEIGELLAIRAEMVAELHEEGIFVAGRCVVEEKSAGSPDPRLPGSDSADGERLPK